MVRIYAVFFSILISIRSQELERGTIPVDEVPAKLDALRKLCGSSGLIPESMKPKDDSDELLKMTRDKYPPLISQSEFNLGGRKVAIKVIRLYVPQKLDEPLSVSTVPYKVVRKLSLTRWCVAQRFCRDAVAWKHLRHPNIIPLLSATLHENRLCLISEWMDQGNINEFLTLKQHSEVNRIELVSCDLSRNEPRSVYLTCLAGGHRRWTIVHARASRYPWKSKRGMPPPLVS